MFLVGAVLLWLGARSAGLIDNIETLVEDLGFAGEGTYQLKGPEILKMTAVIGPILVVLGSLATVAGVAVFNAMSRLFGGVEVTVSDGDDLGPRSKRSLTSTSTSIPRARASCSTASENPGARIDTRSSGPRQFDVAAPALDGQQGVPGPRLEALDLLFGEDALLQPVGDAVDDLPDEPLTAPGSAGRPWP